MARRLAESVLCAWAVVALEIVLVFVLNRARLASVWEVQYGLLWLGPTLLGAAAIVGVAGGVVCALAERSETRSIRLLLALLVAVFGFAAGYGVGGGRHLSVAAVRLGFALGIGAAGGVFTWWAAPRLARQMRTRPDAVAGLAAAAIAVLLLASRLLFVRRYPAFHEALALGALLISPLIALVAPKRTPGTPRSRKIVSAAQIVLALFVLVELAFARRAAAHLAYFDNLRLILVDEAPLAGQGVLLSARLAPSLPDPNSACGPSDECGDASTQAHKRTSLDLDLRGRDFVLVTVDALRADHVGVYGYGRRTTPALDTLSREGVVFEWAYAPTPHTSYSVTSLMTGKYMRPLLLQNAGQDSETWATLFRMYGYRTAAFYPPAVFFIDPARFETFQSSFLGFEYRKVEFLEGVPRAEQVENYVAGLRPEQRLFLWVHLFGPHEPYEAHKDHDFGDRDIDRYDSEIAEADQAMGRIVAAVRRARPNAVAIVTADHGEEFGEHGGRYHGTSVYEEQVRVPLVIVAPGAIAPRRIREPVQTIDLLPTVLAALDIPRPPRLRGRELGDLLAGHRPDAVGFAHAETDDQALLAEGTLRLVCQKRLGACQLFDVSSDPLEHDDASSDHAERLAELRGRLRELGASHGRFEVRGLRAEGRGWPAPILRGIAGDADAAEDIAALLDDADVTIRRKAAELLFELERRETAPALRLALGRNEDAEVKGYCALALTRLGEGAPLAFELVKSQDLRWRRLAALALAKAGDRRGEETLIGWWRDIGARDYARSRDLLDAFTLIRSRDAVWPIVQSLGDVRLRPYIASTLAAIGEDVARGPLARALSNERYQSARVALTRALVKLRAEGEIVEPLVRFLGVPDPLPGGLEAAVATKNLERVGGPDGRDLAKLRRQADLGVAIDLIVPRGGNGRGVRALVRAHAEQDAGVVRIGARLQSVKYDRHGMPIKTHDIPRIDSSRSLELRVPASPGLVEVHGIVPASLGVKPGQSVQVVVVADQNVHVDALALLPLADELPPPPPEPWKPEPATADGSTMAGAQGTGRSSAER